jgi:hypothetical protein
VPIWRIVLESRRTSPVDRGPTRRNMTDLRPSRC